jgi:hypothetical protein
MDPDWGRPSAAESKLTEVEDERLEALARALFRGFNAGPHLDTLNARNGIRIAHAIDELIKSRVEEALSVNRQPVE